MDVKSCVNCPENMQIDDVYDADSDGHNGKSKCRTVCIVPGCKQKYRPGISFHSFPAKTDKTRYLNWIQRLRLKVEPSKTSRVCSLHFTVANFISPTTNRLTDRLVLRPSAVPDLNLPEAPMSDARKKLKEARAERALNRSLKSKTDAELPGELPNLIHGDSDQPKETVHMVDTEVQVNTTDWDNIKVKRTAAILFGNDDDLLAWTGLKSRAMLQSIVKAVTLLKQYRRRHLSSVKLEEEILIVFIKLKTNLSFRCISVLFRLHSQTVSACFQRILPFLSATLKPLLYWPSEEQIKQNIPYYFRPDFEDVIAVLDCTEIPIMKPKCLHCRIYTYSHYKSRETAMYLVAVTPGYGGKTSDKQIVIEEKILDRFEPGQAVMTDKGFMIGDECKQKGVKLVRPPFLNAPQRQLSKTDATLNISIAAARVHVERAIQRIRIFSFFNSKVDTRFLPVLDDLMIIACGVVNLSNPFLANKRF